LLLSFRDEVIVKIKAGTGNRGQASASAAGVQLFRWVVNCAPCLGSLALIRFRLGSVHALPGAGETKALTNLTW